MAHQIDCQIVGDDMQAAIITLDPLEIVSAEAGSMMFMEDGIEMNTEMQGGFLGGLKRKIGGESFFITTFKNNSSSRKNVSFASPYPGKIIQLNLSETGPMLCQRDAYLCSAYGIDVSIAFTKRLGAGFFGGEGFILEKLSGDGIALIHAGGTILKKQLAAGESIKVDTGCLVALQETVDYDIQMVSGIKTMLFGGEGIFFALLTGPGTIYIQTLPFSRLADRIVSSTGMFGASRDETRRGGGILGQIIGGDR